MIFFSIDKHTVEYVKLFNLILKFIMNIITIIISRGKFIIKLISEKKNIARVPQLLVGNQVSQSYSTTHKIIVLLII